MKLRRPGNTPPPAPASTSSAEYSEPNRNWTRVGVLAGGWALVLGLGAWVGPGIVEGGASTESAIDQPPTDPTNAAGRYFRVSYNDDDLGPAEDVLCDNSSVEFSPSDLKTQIQDVQDGSAGRNVEVSGETVSNDGQTTILRYQVRFLRVQPIEDAVFDLEVTSDGDDHCVSSVQLTGGSLADDPSDSEDSSNREPAINFVSAIFSRNNIGDAESLLCGDYSGPAPGDIREFHDVFAVDPESQGDRSFGDAETADADIVINVAIDTADGEVVLPFVFTVEADCILEIEDIDEIDEMLEDDSTGDGESDESDDD